MTYDVSVWTLNPTIPTHTPPQQPRRCGLLNEFPRLILNTSLMKLILMQSVLVESSLILDVALYAP